MTDAQLLREYYAGFIDSLDNKIDKNREIDNKAYRLGNLHAVIGDDVKSVDGLTQEEILKILKR